MIVPSNLYSVITHPHRRTIIKEIYLEREGTIKHFKENLHFKPGTLYHHLKILINSKIITQSKKRKYLLTPLGEKIVIELLEERELLIESSPDTITSETVNSMVINKLTFVEKVINQVFDKIYQYSIILLIINLIAIILLFVNLVELKLGILGCFMYQTNELLESLLSLLFSIAFVSVLIWILPRVFGKSEPISLELIILTISLYFPISMASGMVRIAKIVTLANDIHTPVLIVSQLGIQLFWIIWIYLIVKGIFLVEKTTAVIISLMINYLLLTLTLLVIL